MPSESSTWNLLRPLMAGLDPVRVENLVQVGTPDINYTRGWIELKYLPRWPVRGGIVTIKHFKKEQRTWLKQRRLAGGAAFVILRVGEEWLLFEGMTAALFLGFEKRQETVSRALKVWPRTPTKEELQLWL